MRYELARKLKDAGFSQDGKSNSFLVEKDSDANSQDFVGGFIFQNKDKYIYNPTLSELIEACGGRFSSLEKGREDTWLAKGGKPIFEDGRDYEFEEFGSTPEEAVANLWLELHEK